MHVSPTTAALALLLVVLCVATFGRVWMATAAAVAATLCLNFFFLPPVGTFTIADPENWVALVVFLIVAIIGSQLSAAAQSRAREAARGALASTLLATLSHDLRTPLTAIRVALGNVAESTSERERAEQAHLALRELDRLNHLFDQILDMARIDAHAITPDRQWVTPADIVDAAVVYVRPALEGRTVRIDASADVEAEVDPRLTSAALAHLLENAAHYSSADAPVAVIARADGGQLEISVIDRGPGLDPTELDRLFERFYRGRAARQTPLGTGMGLAITRGLLAAVGGRVTAENMPGGGARFAIVVPATTRTATVLET